MFLYNKNIAIQISVSVGRVEGILVIGDYADISCHRVLIIQRSYILMLVAHFTTLI